MDAEVELDRHAVEKFAAAIAEYHSRAEVLDDCDLLGGQGVILEKITGYESDIINRDNVDRLATICRRTMAMLAPHFKARMEKGFVRRCHGGLKLGDIIIEKGVPVVRPANDKYAGIDVLYDFASLLVDLHSRSLRRLASIALNRYLDITGDIGGIRALPLFMSLRTMENLQCLQKRVGDYLNQALECISLPPPRLVAVGGLSGCGKSRMSREVAPLLCCGPGAVVVRSDVVRKRLAGVPILSRLGPEGYTEKMSELTYRTMFDDVRTALEAGFTVVADCVFAKPEQRRMIAEVADGMGVPFNGLWLETNIAERQERVVSRIRNVSDVTAKVARQQLDYDTGNIEWDRVDSSGSRQQTLEQGLALLEQGGPIFRKTVI